MIGRFGPLAVTAMLGSLGGLDTMMSPNMTDEPVFPIFDGDGPGYKSRQGSHQSGHKSGKARAKAKAARKARRKQR